MRLISLANQTFVRLCRSSTSLILLPMCRLIDRVFWAADDIPISDRHKKSVESIFRPFTHTEVFATHTHRNRQRITTPYRYNKVIQNYAYRYDTPLRSFIVAKFLMYVECCEDSEHQKQCAINALHIYVLCPTRRFATASD